MNARRVAQAATDEVSAALQAADARLAARRVTTYRARVRTERSAIAPDYLARPIAWEAPQGKGDDRPTLFAVVSRMRISALTLAARTRLDPEFLSQAIIGRAAPTPAERERIARALGWDVGALRWGVAA